MTKLIEVSSYPKSGNTWMRYILAQLFGIDVHRGIPDYHQQGANTASLVEKIRARDEFVGFYKSHVTDCSAIGPYRIMCIYRHPLDVFLSCLNYFYITGKRSAFRSGNPVGVDELYASGELSKYFNRFLEHAGEEYYPELLGEHSNYFAYMQNALENERVTSVKYEDLYDQPPQTLRDALIETIGLDVGVIDASVFEAVNKKTKLSNDTFYWKATKGTYRSYLTPQQIREFENKYARDLMRLGFLDAPTFTGARSANASRD